MTQPPAPEHSSTPAAPAARAGDPPALLEVRGLAVEVAGADEPRRLLDGVDFDLRRGAITGLVGESGSGKTLSVLALLDLLPPTLRRTGGSVRLDGHGDLLALEPRRLRRVRGREVGVIFQEPGAALNPVLTVGFQIAESLRLHRGLSRREAKRRGLELLERVAVPDPASRWRAYPGELSGGQQQRAVIAMALAPRPRLLLADEPTTALDVTVQAQVLELLDDLRRDLGLTVLLVTHDLAVVAETCDHVLVMDHGRVVEGAPVDELFARPRRDETRRLLAAVTGPAAPGGAG